MVREAKHLDAPPHAAPRAEFRLCLARQHVGIGVGQELGRRNLVQKLVERLLHLKAGAEVWGFGVGLRRSLRTGLLELRAGITVRVGANGEGECMVQESQAQGRDSSLLARACCSVACRVSTPSKAVTRRGRAISATSDHATSAQRTRASQNSGNASAGGGGGAAALVALVSLGSVTPCERRVWLRHRLLSLS